MKRIHHQPPAQLRFPSFWTWVCSVILAVMIGLGSQPMLQIATASQQVEFRVSRLETETRSLRSQINQLDAELNRLARMTGNSRPAPTITPPTHPLTNSPPSPGSAPADDRANLPFDQLATLVIETRQDMFRLQEQVEAIATQLEITLPDRQ